MKITRFGTPQWLLSFSLLTIFHFIHHYTIGFLIYDKSKYQKVAATMQLIFNWRRSNKHMTVKWIKGSKVWIHDGSKVQRYFNTNWLGRIIFIPFLLHLPRKEKDNHLFPKIKEASQTMNLQTSFNEMHERCLISLPTAMKGINEAIKIILQNIPLQQSGH